MAIAVFPFARSVRPRCAEWPDFSTRKGKLTGGFTERSPEYGDDFLLRAVFSLEFPQRSTSKTVADFLAFVEATRGAALTFLLSFYTDRYRVVTGAGIGTGDGSETDFPLSHRYIDASTLVVKKDGTPTAAYTLEDNEAAAPAGPFVRFTAAPAGGVALTVDFEFRVPVNFEKDSLEVVLRAALGADSKKSVRIDGVQVEEAQPGARLVVA